MLKLNENPPVLFPEVENLSMISGPWWIAHTKSRCEKAFAWNLATKKIGYFLPMVERIKISGGKKRYFVLPLFPSYVFLCGNDDDCYRSRSKHLCQMIKVVDQEKLVKELKFIEKALQAKMELDLFPQLAIGQRCRVMAGSLKGLEGVVISQNKRARVVLEVSILGRGAIMEIDADLLELCA
ncbi:MAG: transcription termination/antitermination NusG family protein [Phycisphaerae bacterium]